jgi:DNA-directed RNA polymerase specialized sigma24 family protein
VQLASKQLTGISKRSFDEEDVALSVFHSVCHGVSHGRYPSLHDRNDLWRLLLTVTRHKIIDHVRGESCDKRGGGKVSGESIFTAQNGSVDLGGLQQAIADEITPEFLVCAKDEIRHLLGRLRSESLRNVAVWRLEGFTNDEIAQRLGISERTVERKLKLIRQEWSEERSP